MIQKTGGLTKGQKWINKQTTYLLRFMLTLFFDL